MALEMASSTAAVLGGEPLAIHANEASARPKQADSAFMSVMSLVISALMLEGPGAMNPQASVVARGDGGDTGLALNVSGPVEAGERGAAGIASRGAAAPAIPAETGGIVRQVPGIREPLQADLKAPFGGVPVAEAPTLAATGRDPGGSGLQGRFREAGIDEGLDVVGVMSAAATPSEAVAPPLAVGPQAVRTTGDGAGLSKPASAAAPMEQTTAPTDRVAGLCAEMVTGNEAARDGSAPGFRAGRTSDRPEETPGRLATSRSGPAVVGDARGVEIGEVGGVAGAAGKPGPSKTQPSEESGLEAVPGDEGTERAPETEDGVGEKVTCGAVPAEGGAKPGLFKSASLGDQARETAPGRFSLKESRALSETLLQESLKKLPRSVELRMEPPELGKVTVLLSQRGGDVTVKFLAGTGEGQRILSAAARDLERALSERGLTLAGFSVDPGNRDQMGDGRGGNAERRRVQKYLRATEISPAAEGLVTRAGEGLFDRLA